MNTLQFEMHPRIKNDFIQKDLALLSDFLKLGIEENLTTDQLYDIIETMIVELDTLKEY